jgi:hypothetical protein
METRKIKTVGGYIMIQPEGHVNAFVAKSGSWRHFGAESHPNPITAGLTWIAMIKDCIANRSNQP